MANFEKYDPVEMLKEKLKKHCGLIFDGQRDTYFRQKLEDRIRELGIKSAADYNHHLMTGDDYGVEWQNLINAVTINETYFFREKNQLDALKKFVLPEVMRKREPFRHLRILSAACANGAEPYSLAIMLSTKGIADNWRIEIEGSDINEKNLETARQGCYTEFDIRSLDPLSKATFFERHNSRYILLPSIRERVRFFQMNLLNFFAIRSREPYQIILCRNVLYYFDIPTREKVISALADSLSAEGYLFAGQTEFIGDLTIPFKTCRQGEVVYYQKTSGVFRGSNRPNDAGSKPVNA